MRAGVLTRVCMCRIEEEEWDNYSIPSKVESEKYKVIRTFSFLKSRMSSTRSKNKVNASATHVHTHTYTHKHVAPSLSPQTVCAHANQEQ